MKTSEKWISGTAVAVVLAVVGGFAVAVSKPSGERAASNRPETLDLMHDFSVTPIDDEPDSPDVVAEKALLNAKATALASEAISKAKAHVRAFVKECDARRDLEKTAGAGKIAAATVDYERAAKVREAALVEFEEAMEKLDDLVGPKRSWADRRYWSLVSSYENDLRDAASKVSAYVISGKDEDSIARYQGIARLTAQEILDGK